MVATDGKKARGLDEQKVPFGCSRNASFWWDQGTGVYPTLTLNLTLTSTQTKTDQKRAGNAAASLSHRTRKFADNSERGRRFRTADHAYSIIKAKPALKIFANICNTYSRFLVLLGCSAC